MNVRSLYRAIIASAIISVNAISNVSAQNNVAINSTGAAPSASAILDASSTSQGVLIPRMTDAQRQALKSPTTGLMIYNTNTNEFNFWTGIEWDSIPRTAAPAGSQAGGVGPGGGIAINNTGALPDPSAILDVSSANKGLVIPRTTTGISAVQGLIIYNSTTNAINWYDGSSWQAPCSQLIDNNKGAGATVNGIAINSTGAAPNASSILDISSINQGILIPRMTPAQRDLIKTPAQGLMIYDLTNDYIEYWSGSGWYQMGGTSWVSLTPTGGPPTARNGIEDGVWDALDNVVLVFGGGTSTGYLNDLWAYDPAANTWTQLIANAVAGSPSPRYAVYSIWDPVDNEMLMFGGGQSCCTTFYNDIWAYKPGAGGSTGTWTQLSPTGGPPSIRDQGATVWDATNNVMLIYGGFASGGRVNDLWSFKPSGSAGTWTQLIANGVAGSPSVCNGQAAVWDAANGRMIMEVGYYGAGNAVGLYAYTPGAGGSTGSWSTLSLSGPAISDESMVLNPINNTLYFYAGWVNVSLVTSTDIYTYNLTTSTWAHFQGCNNPGVTRWTHTGVWDPLNNKMYIFGGATTTGTGYLNDTWKY